MTPLRTCRRLGFALLGLALAGSVVADTPSGEKAAPKSLPPPLAKAHLAPSLRAAALRDGVKVRGDDGVSEIPRSGDAVVLWVGARDEKKTQQWLIRLSRDEPTAKEVKEWEGRARTKYLSWGPVVTFESKPEALRVWIAGPAPIDEPETAEQPAPAPTKELRLSIAGDYLRLGLDQSARVDMHINRRRSQAKRDGDEIQMGGLFALQKPVDEDQIERSKAIADRIGFTPEMARAWIGGFVALQAFYEAANEVPELAEIASVAVERPSLWKMAKAAFGTKFVTNVGGLNTRVVDPGRLGLPEVGAESYALGYGMSFGRDPLVYGEMVVTTPTPPFDVSAGILGLVAVNPRNHDKKVHLVVVGTQRGPEATTGAASTVAAERAAVN